MRKATKIEIIFGVFALALIYFVISSNASITGFLVSPTPVITLVYPPNNAELKQTSIEFMFKYPYEVDMSECSLLINSQVAKTTMGILTARDTRIRIDLNPGSYYWKVECVDNDGLTLFSDNRHLRIIGQEESKVKVSTYKEGAGSFYEFELEDDLEIELEKLEPNDIIQVKMDGNVYELTILRIIQEYSTGVERADFIIMPGSKRVSLKKGSSIDIDFDDDQENDLNLLLTDVSYQKAYFIASTKTQSTSTNLAGEASLATRRERTEQEPEVASSEQAEEKIEQQPSQIPKKTTTLGTLELFLIGLIVVLIIALLLTGKGKKADDEKQYINSLKKNVNRVTQRRFSRKSKSKPKKKR